MITYLSNCTTYCIIASTRGMEEYLSGGEIGQWVCSVQWTGRIWRLPSPEFTRHLKQIWGRFIKFMINMPNTGKQRHPPNLPKKLPLFPINAPAANRKPKQLFISTNTIIRI